MKRRGLYFGDGSLSYIPEPDAGSAIPGTNFGKSGRLLHNRRTRHVAGSLNRAKLNSWRSAIADEMQFRGATGGNASALQKLPQVKLKLAEFAAVVAGRDRDDARAGCCTQSRSHRRTDGCLADAIDH